MHFDDSIDSEPAMKLTLLFAVTALLATADGPEGRATESSDLTPGGSEGTSLLARPLETFNTEVKVGDEAPDFSYQGVDGHWLHLQDILVHGPVLLVFGADELTLRVIEHERERLMDLGVVPVAVTDARSGAARAMVSRNALLFTVLSDARGAIASQFNTVDPTTGRHRPAWFVVDPRRRVRGLGRRALPLRGYAALVASALGLPAPGGTVPAAR
jgi:peroxiredoxin